jgi:hypothetical protein
MTTLSLYISKERANIEETPVMKRKQSKDPTLNVVANSNRCYSTTTVQFTDLTICTTVSEPGNTNND